MNDKALQSLLEATEQLSEELKEVKTLIDETHAQLTEILAQLNEAPKTQDKSKAVVHCTLISKESMQLSDLDTATDFKKLCSDLKITPCLYYEHDVHAYFCKLENVVVTISWLAEHQCEDPLFYDLGGFQFFLGNQVDYIKAE